MCRKRERNTWNRGKERDGKEEENIQHLPIVQGDNEKSYWSEGYSYSEHCNIHCSMLYWGCKNK